MKSIKTKFILVIIMTCVFIGCNVAVFSVINAKRTVTTNVESQMTVLAQQAVNTIDKAIESKFVYLEGLATNEKLDSDNAEVKEFLSEQAKAKNLNLIGLADLDGDTLSGESNVSNQEFFQAALKGERGLTEPEEDPKNPGTVIMYFAVPVYRNGTISKVLYMQCSGEYLSQLTNGLVFGKTGNAFLINKEGTTIAHQTPDKVVAKENLIKLSETNKELTGMAKLFKKAIEGGSGYDVYEYSGVKKCVGYAELPKYGWHIMVNCTYKELYAGLTGVYCSLLSITLTSVILFSIIGAYIANRLVKPIKEVQCELNYIANGDFTHEISSTLLAIKDETGMLARSLAQMQEKLRFALREVNDQSAQVIEYAKGQRTHVNTLMGNVESVSSTTEELSASMQETSASTEQMSTSAVNAQNEVEKIASRASDGQKTAAEIKERAQALESSSLEAQKAATDIYHESMVTLEKAIEESKKVDEINRLSDAILSITSQTNLLALNASIEAARAGEAGRGFSVVATEIGKLADDSQKSANEIKEVTEIVLNSVSNLSDCAKKILNFLDGIVMKDYEHMVDTGRQYNEDAVCLNEMVTDFSITTQNLFVIITDISKTLSDVAQATEESANGTNVIAESSSEIALMTNKVSELAQETSDKALALEKAVSIFKL